MQDNFFSLNMIGGSIRLEWMDSGGVLRDYPTLGTVGELCLVVY